MGPHKHQAQQQGDRSRSTRHMVWRTDPPTTNGGQIKPRPACNKPKCRVFAAHCQGEMCFSHSRSDFWAAEQRVLAEISPPHFHVACASNFSLLVLVEVPYVLMNGPPQPCIKLWVTSGALTHAAASTLLIL
eukprot:EG_transcript_39891